MIKPKFPQRQLPLLVTVLILVFTACSDETIVYQDEQSDIILEESEAVLQQSVVMDNAGVLDIFEEESLASGKLARANDEIAGDFPLTLVAQISPPSFSGGDNLTASHVHLEGNYVYVSYNTVDEAYVGGIDIIYIGDPNNPRVTSRLYYLNADISSVKYDGGFVYAVGGVDSETSVTAEFNSFVAKIAVSNGRFNISSGISYGFQEGFVATDVETTAELVIVTSGKDGYITQYRKSDMEKVQDAPFSDLRSLELNGNTIGVLDADYGVRLLDENLSETAGIPIDADFRIADKRTMAFSSDKIFVSEGSTGAGIYDLATGSFLAHVPILVNPDDVAESDIVTNAVSTNEEVLLMANGGAGLCLSEGVTTDTELVGIIALNGSINYVESKDDYIFAASGREGLQIIKMNRPSNSLKAACADSPPYNGSSRLNVAAGDDVAYSGSRRFREVNVAGALLLCGSWTVRDEVNVDANGLFEMNGTLVVARNSRRRDVTVGEGATLRIEGDLTIYGDLIVTANATLEFLGSDSVVNVLGDVVIDGDATVTGTFEDVQGKF
ncbi:MAG: hypothetical protein AAGB24_11295 [Bacteroidota bacterium]